MGAPARAALAMGFPTAHNDAHGSLAVNAYEIAVAFPRDADADSPLRFREIKQLSHNSLLSNLCSIIAGALRRVNRLEMYSVEIGVEL
jgi:hypothetical protein